MQELHAIVESKRKNTKRVHKVFCEFPEQNAPISSVMKLLPFDCNIHTDAFNGRRRAAFRRALRKLP
eukprot:10520971-Lingulodinium_polyedra.AAC.1